MELEEIRSLIDSCFLVFLVLLLIELALKANRLMSVRNIEDLLQVLVEPIHLLKQLRKRFASAHLPVNKEAKSLVKEIISNPEKINGDAILRMALSLDWKKIGYRILVLIVSGAWFAFFPVYIFVIYMHERNFFSYDFYTHGVFGLNAFVFSMLSAIAVLSLYLFGYLTVLRGIWLEYVSENKLSKSKRCVFYSWLVSSLLIWLLVYEINSSSNNIKLFEAVSVISLLLVAYGCTFITNDRVRSTINWKPSAIFLTATITIPFIAREHVAEVVDIAIDKFRMGGNQYVEIYERSEGQKSLILSGDLLFLSPKNVFVRLPQGGKDNHYVLHVYPQGPNTHLVIRGLVQRQSASDRS